MSVHLPVLLPSVMHLLSPLPGETYVDCTAGLGGHASAAAALLGPTGKVVLSDLDAGNLAAAGGAVTQSCPGISLTLLHGNFAQLPFALETAGRRANCLLADFGFASPHVDTPARGFSFRHDGPLDMRMDQSRGMTAAELIAGSSERELARIIMELGEERHASRIAKKLVQVRRESPILTTTQLAELIRGIVGYAGGIDPATKTFQALRIAVNDELGSIDALLAAITAEVLGYLRHGRTSWLAPGARLVFITFHSLEDRPVKRALAELFKAGAHDLSGGMVRGDEAEVAANPRARSAKLRALRLPESRPST